MKNTCIYLLFFVPFAFTACLKDDDPVALAGTRLISYTDRFEFTEMGTDPMLKVNYEYDKSGRINRYSISSVDSDLNEFVEQRHFNFFYEDDKVHRIQEFKAGKSTPDIEHDYQYSTTGLVTNIKETNHSAGVNSEAVFTYSESGMVSVAFVYSNGESFVYEFDYSSANISADKTIKGTELCSNGEYTYDIHHNPFKDLGYVDYRLTNLSSNNKLTENVSYIGCAFPNLIPLTYAYEYNERGYPTKATITYKSDGALVQTKREFFYNEN